MIHLRISRRWLRRAGGLIALLTFLGLCYRLGARLSPRDATGRPILLSPSVYAAERYRRKLVQWTVQMAEVDDRLTVLLNHDGVSDPAELYRMGQEAEELVNRSSSLARESALTPAPAALTGLAEQARAAAEAHLQAALAAARWVGAPQPEVRQAALTTLRQARGLRLQLCTSGWIDGR